MKDCLAMKKLMGRIHILSECITAVFNHVSHQRQWLLGSFGGKEWNEEDC